MIRTFLDIQRTLRFGRRISFLSGTNGKGSSLASCQWEESLLFGSLWHIQNVHFEMATVTLAQAGGFLEGEMRMGLILGG